MKRPLAFVCSSLSFGGLEMNLVKRALWMSLRGWPVVVLCVPQSPVFSYAVESGLRVVPIRRHRKYFDAAASFRLAALLKKERIRIVFIRDVRDMGVCALAKALSAGRIWIVYMQAMQLGVRKRDFFHSVIHRSLDRWVCPLPWLKNQVETMTVFPHDRIRVIPLGADLSLFRTEELDRNRCRDFLGVDRTCLLIGLMGRFSPGKGQDFLIRCFPEIMRALPDVRLILVGETSRNESGEYERRLKEEVRTAGLEERILFRGFMKEVGVFYRALDLFVMASEKETYGMVTVEALIAGARVLGADSGGTKEILGSGEFGVLYRPGDQTDFTAKAVRLLRSGEGPAVPLDEIRRYYSHQEECRALEGLLAELG